MASDIFTAAIPEPYRIFGLKLKVFSIGRYQRLKRFNCAFVADEESGATVEDLLTGVLICSMKCRDFDALSDDASGFMREMRRWGKHIRRELKAPGFNIIEKFNLFKHYISEAQKIPPFWNEIEDSSESGSHWSHSMEVVLRSEVGWTQEEIEERPFTKAVYDWLKWAENQGSIRVMTDDEIALGDSNSKAFDAAFEQFMQSQKGDSCPASN